MIIKRTTDDFQVEELADVTSRPGAYALYRLEKTGWTTPDALSVVRRRWRIEHRRLSYGGLKDRHARTVQYFTIFRGPQRRLRQSTISVDYLGQLDEPFTSERINANRFRLILRQLSAGELNHALKQLPQVQAFGVPNYFDDQRFGSVSGGGPFLARALLLGQYEEALRLALTASYPHDRKPQKQEKQILRQHWRDWTYCKEHLPRGHARSLIDYLAHHPDDCRGALARLRPELRGLYLSAYQSHLWNRTLAAWLSAADGFSAVAGDTTVSGGDAFLEVPLLLGAVPMHRALLPQQLEALSRTSIPLHSPRATFAGNDSIAPFFRQVLEEEGLTLEQFRLKGFKEMFFSRGERAALCLPANLSWRDEADDLYPGRSKLHLDFDLPRGSYATLIVKRITLLQQPAPGVSFDLAAPAKGMEVDPD